ncbi:MAG TPA: hypothetical protein VNT75_05360 [Symbiobacteriaceae bacterium]|nr:hypothetical protein [Symbiobacteriaceae bacterium]
MGRPVVQVPTENRLAQLREHLNKTLPRFIALPGAEGITLNGGMSRGYADHLSEVDVTIYLTEDEYDRYQRGLTQLTAGIVIIDGQLYDIKLCSLSAELGAQWPDVARWDASYAEILHDPQGKVAALYAKHLAEAPQVGGAGGPLFECWWHYHLAGNIWIHRRDGLQAHLILNRAIEPLVKSLFIANGEYVPHEKWLIHMSRTLAWRPEAWEERLGAALTIAAPTVETALERQRVIKELWDEIDRYVVSKCCPKGYPLRLMHKGFYELLMWLVERGEVTLAEWTARARGATLSAAPFNDCVTLDGDTVRLDRERLLALKQSDLDPWFYEVVAAVQSAAV